MLTDDQKAELHRVACNTFDLCGNMTRAVREWAADNGWGLTDEELGEIVLGAQIECTMDQGDSW